MTQSEETMTTNDTWLDRPVSRILSIKLEPLVFVGILIVAFFTRFYDLESRVMSHDETSHVYFSWLLFRGQGYAHDPVTHGPLQFHLVALSYFLFGDNDFTARIPAALFSITTIAFAWAYRNYLGRIGALIAGAMLIISPYLLYYGRYVRNEAFVGLFFMINLWAVLRYLETGRLKYMIWLTSSLALHFAAKETSFIYAAQTLLFLGFYFIYRITKTGWENHIKQLRFLGSLIIGITALALAIGVLTFQATPSPGTTDEFVSQISLFTHNPVGATLVLFSFISVGISLYYLVTGYGADALRRERSFSLMLVVFTIVLPQLAPFAMNFLGIQIPVNATQVNNLQPIDMFRMFLVLIPFILIAVGAGMWWNARQWLMNAGIFYGIFLILFTTFFTNGAGFFTGLVGSLGYWLAQQEVQRGSQPYYYYLLIQIPIYEYLPALGVIVATIVRLLQLVSRWPEPINDHDNSEEENKQHPPVFSFLGFWTVTSALSFTIAGEKMPWLTFHIALPMILMSAWGFGKILEIVDWHRFKSNQGWLVILTIPVFAIATTVTLGSLFGAHPPFQGQSIEQLGYTATFIVSLAATILSAAALAYLMRDWSTSLTLQIFTVFATAVLGILTLRTAFRAAYINYDNATEYLVYAHSAPGVKIALAEIEDLSKRLTGTLDLAIAYDNDTTYPYWWYLRNYPKQRYFGGNPSRDLRDAPAILVGDSNYAKLEPILGKAYHQFSYIRIWWPNQDYFDVSLDKVFQTIRDPEMRSAVFKIWLNRDYSDYARLTGKDMSLSNWYPSGRMRLYVRKDVINQIWEYGSSTEVIIEADPFEGKEAQLFSDMTIGSEGSLPGEFKKPRNIAVAQDGTLYVADSENHRIQHLSTDGRVLHIWGRFADSSQGEAPGGTFYEPWDVAVDSDGFVYVADTWNHRVQKFTPEGQFVTMWGFFGQAESPQGFWGPRGLTVDQNNRIYLTDTGNKRIVVFTSDGSFVTEFGLSGYLPGEFNEPVGIAITTNGEIYVTDTWNQRVQVMAIDENNTFRPVRQWDILGWYGQSLENKPYIVVDHGRVFVSDPENYRIIQFNDQGELIRYWGIYGGGNEGLNLPIGLAVDPLGGLWVADSGNHRIVHYQAP
jgi:predicted membrane-bound mannosyltransferase/DNA-binding beta-propeller fold protein YncE